MAAIRPNFGDLLEPGFLEIFNDSYREPDRVYSKIFNVRTSNKQDERFSSVTGFSLLTVKAENATIDYDDPIQGYDILLSHVTYAKGFKISKELWDDDQYNIMNEKPRQLGVAARRTEETVAANVFNRGFNSGYLGGDDQELFSTVHPREDAGTSQSNASSIGLTFGEENYEVGKLAMRGQLDGRGQIIEVMPSVLLIPQALKKTADIVFKSNLRSGTADNDFNPYLNEVQVVEWLYMNRNTTHWFLIDKDTARGLVYLQKEKLTFSQDEAWESDAALFKVRERFSVGFYAWRGTWGSQGDGAAYSG